MSRMCYVSLDVLVSECLHTLQTCHKTVSKPQNLDISYQHLHTEPSFPKLHLASAHPQPTINHPPSYKPFANAAVPKISTMFQLDFIDILT